MMEPVLERFAAEVRRVDLRPPTLPYLSNRTGTWITAAEATDPGYWVRHMVSTVRFGDSLGTLLAAEGSILLEVGPGRALSTLVRRHPMGWARPVLAALGPARDGAAEPAALLTAVGKLWVAGGAMDVTGFWAREHRRRVPLPTYPFERRSYWRDGRRAASPEPSPPSPLSHPHSHPPGRGGTGTPIGTAVEKGVAAVFEELLGVSGVRPQDDFFDLGGSSLMALRLGARLRETLGADLPASALLEASTVEALAERIAAAGGDRPSPEADRPSCLIRLRAGESGRPLFLVHQVGGHVYSFRALTRALAPGRPIYGLRSRGLEAGEELLTSVEEMADHYLALVREVQPHGPYLLGGASMGGVVALEMAQRLRAAGEDVPLLTLMDVPSRDVLPEQPSDEGMLAQVLPFAPRLTPEEIRGLAPEEQLARGIEKAQAAGGLPAGFDIAEAERLLRVQRANVAALFAYALRSYDRPVLFFRARERRPGDPLRPEEPWIDLAAGGIEIHVVPGDHATMHEPPHVQTMAAWLERRLSTSEDRVGSWQVMARST
jgi:thioesterase domain-containing protein/acyl carrier protein